MANILPALLLITKLILFFSKISSAKDTITHSESLLDNMTLVSNDGTFELGFFTPGSSTNRYVGIWYKNIPDRTVVWVANRDNPIKDNSSQLSITTEGNLVLLNKNNTVIWSTNTTAKSANVVLQLIDSANLVLKDEEHNIPENYLWQSFDYPSDTLLSGMKLGWDFKTGLNRRLIAWKNWDDPSPGDFIGEIVLTNNPEVIMWKGSTKFSRSGPRNGDQFSGDPVVRNSSTASYVYVSNKDGLYLGYIINDKSLISRMVMNQTLNARQRLNWNKDSQSWRVSSQVPSDLCDNYNTCGPFGICIVNEAPVCKCLDGFKPKALQNWTQLNFNQGCVLNQTWTCKDKSKDGFHKFSNVKAPDTERSWLNTSMTLEECKAKCWENCSCTAFANSDIRGEGSGCAIWFGDLLDIRLIPSAGQDLYIRLAVPKIAQASHDTKEDSNKMVVVITSTVSSIFLMVLIFIFIYWRNKTKIKEIITRIVKKNNESEQDFELPLFDLTSIATATNHFSDHNKLGEGGFGPVYKGTLPNGQQIAVKRLSQMSKQGLKEFKNEVILCAKLQHRNLVKVQGCCIQQDEKLLIYEFMANKSLDFFLFDSSKSKFLDWPTRFNIINGITRGLLYLHQDSRLRIIHRDLKTSNILLDNEMNPKISDFGLARMCGYDQIEGKTNKVVGTYGYMAPEYVFDGIFSIKSDMFSFGVLLLEILSGKKNSRLFYPNNNDNLIGHAWKLWKEGNPIQFIDTSLVESCNLFEALRCIQIGLLCVQPHPNDRPNMATVVVLLSNENSIPQPKDPSYLIEEIYKKGESDPENVISSFSVNDVTISTLTER